MSEQLIKRYKNELSNKISLKMIPNKTEEQILLQFFKYFDLNGSGMCDLRNFIKTHERIGVVLSKIKDIEEVFNFFDPMQKGEISYRQFAHDIFNMTIGDSSNLNKAKRSEGLVRFIDILNNALTNVGGPTAFVNFVKRMQIVDYNGIEQITIDDFVKVVNECKLNITSKEYQILLQSYDYYINGVLYYMRLVLRMIDNNWDQQRELFTDNLYNRLSNKVKGFTLNDIRQFYNQIENNPKMREDFNNFLTGFKYITKIYDFDAPLKKNEFKNLIKFYGFNIDNKEELENIFSPLGEIGSNYNKRSNFKHGSPLKNIEKNFNSDTVVRQLIINLRKFGRKILFNYIKHFKYYDNDTKLISKFDFAKVIRDYRLNLPIMEIEKIFEEYGTDGRKMFMQYEEFLKSITNNIFSPQRRNIVIKAYNYIENLSKKDRRNFDINFIKSNYIAKKNILNPDENSCKVEFDECLELFHFCYKMLKTMVISLDEFVEFYSFISLLIENDIDFVNMIKSEWFREVDQLYQEEKEVINNGKNEKYQNLSNLRQPPKTKYLSRYSKQQTTFLSKDPLQFLKQKLIDRGIRGLIYLHRQFLLSCRDLNKISFDDFVSVLQLQHIQMNEDEYMDLFSKFSRNEYLDFQAFIRTFKKELNQYKLKCVEKAYSAIDVEENEKVPIEIFKEQYDASKHPDVLSGKRNEEEKIDEFLDCFEINFYQLMNDDDNNNEFVNFEIFANFYEYIAFVYDNDREFENIVNGTWGC